MKLPSPYVAAVLAIVAAPALSSILPVFGGGSGLPLSGGSGLPFGGSGFPFGSPLSPPPSQAQPQTNQTGFKLVDNIVGKAFYDNFNWETEDDPTHGRVNYVSLQESTDKGLTSASSSSFVMRVDSMNVVPSGNSSRGRDSNRISSKKTYEDSITVLDVKHVPSSVCGVWPAFWTVTTGKWPEGGEIDIYEGVNKNTANLASLHTSAGCTMSGQRAQTGRVVSTDCNAYANNNQGCGVQVTKTNSYGDDLNSNGGGWLVMKRTQEDGVYVWFWGRGDPSVPEAVKSARESLDPDNSWGVPDARFTSSDTCNFAAHFNAHKIVFDTTFCGDWAGNAFTSSGCGPGTCVDFVDQNPEAFKDAYWEVNALRVYTP